MAIPSNKQELIEAINQEYGKLSLEFEKIDDKQANDPSLEGHAKGTKMSICNLLSYLIGWGELVLKWNKFHEKKIEIDFPEKGFKWTELGLLAQKFYKDYEDKSFPELQDLLDKTVSKILQLIDSTDNERLYGPGFYKHYPLGRMIQLNTSSPYKNARTRIRKWIRSIKM